MFFMPKHAQKISTVAEYHILLATLLFQHFMPVMKNLNV